MPHDLRFLTDEELLSFCLAAPALSMLELELMSRLEGYVDCYEARVDDAEATLSYGIDT